MSCRRHCRRIAAALLVLGASTANATTDAQAEALYRQLLPTVQFKEIAQTYQEIAAFGSRLTGSQGERATFDYVQRRLLQVGARSIRRAPFTVSVPDPLATGILTIGNKPTKLFPLWPNLVRTSTCHVHGPLVYGADGTLEHLSGKPLNGRIVLLEFNSGSRWRNAAKLGAAAIVFVGPDTMPRAEAEQKFSGVPLDVPRFYLPLQTAGPVLNSAFRGESANLDCRQDWVQKTSYNLTAELPGYSDMYQSEPIGIFAYADAISAVPGISPGGEGIGGIAALLEVARIYSRRPHERPLRLILSGAHGLALKGAREYVKSCLEGAPTPLLTITLDISSGSSTVGSYGRGWFYEFRDETQDVLRETSRLLRAHADHLAKVEGVDPARLVLIDAVNNGDSRSWKNNIPGKFALDCEPMVCAGMNALTFRTVEDGRDSVDTPFDSVSRVRISNVFQQIRTTVVMMHHLLNDTSDKNESSDYRLSVDQERPQSMRLIGGFSTLEGQVVVYDPQKSFIPDEKVPDSLAYVRGKQKTLMGVRGDMVEGTQGPSATYRFDGVAPMTAYPYDQIPLMHMGAVHLDKVSGSIDYAPTWNLPGFDAYETDFQLSVAYRESPIVVFPCVPVDLYDMDDPQSLDALATSRVFDPQTGAAPRNFGFFSPPMDIRLSPEVEDTQTLFLMPGQRFQVIAGSRIDWNRLILTHSSIGDEKGDGYMSPGGKPNGTRQDAALSGRFRFVPLETAQDIANLNDTRLQRFRKYRIISPDTVQIEGKARDEIAKAKSSEQRLQWADMDRHSRAAWGYALRAHPIIMATANDVVNGLVFYLFLLIPFSYFLERLIVGNQLLTKQLAWSIGFFISSFLLLRLIHPAFEIVSNPSMVFIAFVMGALSLIVISFILGKFESSMQAVRAQQSGVHEVDIRRSSVAMAAFNLGVGNMRRRKARTVLTTLTLVVMTFIVLSFTSIVNELQLKETPSNFVASYPGLLLRNPGLDPMQVATYRQIANEFGDKATVVRRAYYYGSDIVDAGILSLQRGDTVAEVRAMLGMDPEESQVLDPAKAIYAGRWFAPGERSAMVLPRPVAETLKIDPADVGKAKVRYAGMDFTVVGLADTSALRALTDLDGDGAMPADFTLSKQYQQEKATSNQAFRSYIRIDPSAVFIVPAETAMQLGADLRTIGVRFHRAQDVRPALESLMPRLRLNLYAGVPAVPIGSRQSAIGNIPLPGGGKARVGVATERVPANPLGPGATSPRDPGGVTELSAGSKTPGKGGRGIQDPEGVPELVVRQFSVQQGSKSTGLLLILIQLAIASVFVLNTMIASVIERTREIAIFSSIGLAPNHIAMLFFAESLVYGVLGAVIGYFAAQITAKIIIATDTLHGLVLNFSSTSAVLSAGLVMAVVLGSTIYPAKKAARIAAPAMNDEVFQTDPEGDVWELPLPFSVAEPEAGPLTAFLSHWLKAYEGYTIGEIVTSGTTLTMPSEGRYHLECTMWLAPYDLGISQLFELDVAPSVIEGVYVLDLRLTRHSGDPENWPTVNRRFLGSIRRQFLTWRTLKREERDKYGSAEPNQAEAPAA